MIFERRIVDVQFSRGGLHPETMLYDATTSENDSLYMIVIDTESACVR